MSTRITLIPGTVATALEARRDIARGFKLARRWQQACKWREAEQVYVSILLVEPKHFDSLCGLDAVYQQGGRKEAVARFRRTAAIYRHAVGRWGLLARQRGPLLEAMKIAAAEAGARSRPMASNHA